MTTAVTKSSIAKCVNATAEMEKRIYVLNKIDCECKAKINSMSSELSKESQDLKSEIQRYSSKVCKLEDNLKYVRKSLLKNTLINVGVFLRAHWIMSLLILIPGDYLVNLFFEKVLHRSQPHDLVTTLYAVAAYLIVTTIIILCKTKIQQTKSSKMIQNNIEYYKSMLKYAEDKMKHFLIVEKEKRNIINGLVVQSETCRNSANEIKRTLSNYYKEMNIIPPSYRTIDCLIIFQHVFKNDLADNMRQAVEYYETLVFRLQMKRGMQGLYSQLGQINSTLCGIKGSLNGLMDQISDFSSDTYEMANKMLDNQNTLINESRATRYALESIEYSRTLSK